MILDTCLITAEGTYVQIIEQTDGKQYLPENSGLTAKNRFVYTDTASLDILRLNATTGVEYTELIIADRSNPTDVKIKLERDGWFTSIHVVIPTKKWMDRELKKQHSIIDVYDIVYFTDGKEIYTYTKDKIEKTTFQKLLDEINSNTTISRVDTDYFSVRTLNETCDNLYKTLFESRLYNGGCKINACEANRLDSIISLAKHYVRIGHLAEAERVVEKANYFQLDIKKPKPPQKYLIPECEC